MRAVEDKADERLLKAYMTSVGVTWLLIVIAFILQFALNDTYFLPPVTPENFLLKVFTGVYLVWFWALIAYPIILVLNLPAFVLVVWICCRFKYHGMVNNMLWGAVIIGTYTSIFWTVRSLIEIALILSIGAIGGMTFFLTSQTRAET